MKKEQICGEFYGKFKKTTLENGQIQKSKGYSSIVVEYVNDATYLITIYQDGNVLNNLAYDEGEILRSETQNGMGITSTYIKDGKLIHQISLVTSTSEIVTNYKLKRCKKQCDSNCQ